MPASISEFPDDPVYPPGGLKAFDIEAFEKVETWILEGAHGN
jgi:hypothetical protein